MEQGHVSIRLIGENQNQQNFRQMEFRSINTKPIIGVGIGTLTIE